MGAGRHPYWFAFASGAGRESNAVGGVEGGDLQAVIERLDVDDSDIMGGCDESAGEGRMVGGGGVGASQLGVLSEGADAVHAEIEGVSTLPVARAQGLQHDESVDIHGLVGTVGAGEFDEDGPVGVFSDAPLQIEDALGILGVGGGPGLVAEGVIGGLLGVGDSVAGVAELENTLFGFDAGGYVLQPGEASTFMA